MRRPVDLFADDRVRLPREDALRELCGDLLRTSYRPGEYRLAHGVTSSGYFEKYRFVTRPAILQRLGRFLAELVPPTTDRLAAPTLGAAIIGAAVSLETGLPFAVVRTGPEEDRPGTQRIEGGLYGGERVTLIEDVVVTGTRAAAAVAELRAAGAVVTTVVSVIDGLSGAADRLVDLEYRPLLTVRDVGLPEDVFQASPARAGEDAAPDTAVQEDDA